MGKEIVLFSSEEHTSRQHVSDFLHQLADKIAGTEVKLSKGQEQLVLQIPQKVVLEVKAEQEEEGRRTKRSLEIEIEWTEGEAEGSLTLG